MKWISALVSMALVAGCGTEPADSAGAEQAGSAASATQRGEPDGGRSFSREAEAAADLPEGYSIFPGAKVLTSTTLTQTDGGGIIVVMASAGDPADLMRFYRSQAEAAGITIERQVSSGTSQVIVGSGPGGTTFSFNASAGEGGTIAQLVVGQGSR